MLVVVTMSAFTLLALATVQNSRTMVSVASETRSNLHAYLAAESAVAHARLQLTLDDAWLGTDGFLTVAEDTSFRVFRFGSGPEDLREGFVAFLWAEFAIL